MVFFSFILWLQFKRNYAKIESKRLKLAKKKVRLTKILTESSSGKLMTPKRETILALGILELVQKLKSGELDPVDVMEAYLVWVFLFWFILSFHMFF